MTEKQLLIKLFNNETFLGCLSSESQSIIILAIRDIYTMNLIDNRPIDFNLFLDHLKEYDIPADINAYLLIEIMEMFE